MPDPTRGLLDIRKVADLLDVDPKTVRRMVQRGELPKPVELQTEASKRKPVRWFADEITDYLNKLKYTSERKNLEKDDGTGRDRKGQEGPNTKQAEKPVEKPPGKKLG